MISVVSIDGKEVLVYRNGIRVGEIYIEVDGYYVFEPDPLRNGFWTAEILHEITDILDHKNEDWDTKVKELL
jgi:hypothetical protein